MRTIIYSVFFVLVLSLSSIAYAKNGTNYVKLNDFILEGVSRDISENIPLWVSLIPFLEQI
jgi:hypothetical protein